MFSGSGRNGPVHHGRNGVVYYTSPFHPIGDRDFVEVGNVIKKRYSECRRAFYYKDVFSCDGKYSLLRTQA